MLRWGGLFVALLPVLGMAATPEPAGVPGSERAKIIELMDLTGAKNTGDQVAQMMIEQVSAAMQQANPNVPTRALEVIRDVTIAVLKEHTGELLSEVVRLYEKHFSEEEIDGLLAFYRSPVGAKAAREIPVLMRELGPISAAWAREIQPTLQRRLHDQLAAEGLLH